MRQNIGWVAVGAVVLALAGYLVHLEGLATPGSPVRLRAEARIEREIADWPETPRLTAAMMIERLGPPQRRQAGSLVWLEPAPFKRIAVHRDAPRSPLEQTVRYDLPEAAVAPLLAFGHGLVVDLTENEISARSDSEQLNLLALNLADEIARGRKTAGQAQAFFSKTAAEWASGKYSVYMDGLLFKPQPRRDPLARARYY